MENFWTVGIPEDEEEKQAAAAATPQDLALSQYIQWLVAMFGLIYLSILALKFLWFLICHAWKHRRLQFERYNYYIGQFTEMHGEATWAVISGGADEFGYALACQLAELYKFNICMIDSDEQAMQEKLLKINQKYKVKVRSIQVDFREYTSIKEYDSIIRDALHNIHIGLLIINTQLTDGAQFRKMSHQQVQDVTARNGLHVIYMVKSLLPRIKRRKEMTGVLIVGEQRSVNEIEGDQLSVSSSHLATSLAQALNVEMLPQVHVMSYERGPIKQTDSTYYGSDYSPLEMKAEDATKAAHDCLYELGGDCVTHATFWHELRIKWINSIVPAIVSKLCRGKKWRGKKMRKKE